jgi:hypothetical protein
VRDLMKRLQRLEGGMRLDGGVTRIVRTIVAVDDGRALPWNPRRAYTHGQPQALERNKDETIEAFEARAAAHFPAHYVIG